MADTRLLETAAAKLQAQGVTHILVLRLYESSQSLKSRTEYVLGLTNRPPRFSPGGLPERVKSSAVFFTSGGLDDHPLISDVLKDRVYEISVDPKNENILLLAHGARSEKANRFWLSLLERRASYIQAATPVPFKSVTAMSIREDWPEKREKALADIKTTVENARRNGERVLVISSRIHGPGPYEEILQGLVYEFNGKGIAPHENLTRWIEIQIEDWKASVLDENRK